MSKESSTFALIKKCTSTIFCLCCQTEALKQGRSRGSTAVASFYGTFYSFYNRDSAACAAAFYGRTNYYSLQLVPSPTSSHRLTPTHHPTPIHAAERELMC